MAQYVYTMNRVGKIVPPKKAILKDISLSFFPGAKIGVLGINGSGKSTLLNIMAGIEREFEGEAKPMTNLRVGHFSQEPNLVLGKTVKETVKEGLSDIFEAKKKLEQIYQAYGEPDANFDKLAEEQAKLEEILNAAGLDVDDQLEVAGEALRLPNWDTNIENLSEVRKDASHYVGCCYRHLICFC